MKNPWIALFALWLGSSLPAAEKKLEIYFIDVEAGSATLIVAPSGQSMLIDGGSPNQAGRNLAALKDAGVKKLDYLLVTHFHADHFGADPAIAKQVPVANWVDHGEAVEAHKSEEWKNAHVLRFSDELYDSYLKARESGKHLVVAAGDKIPVKGVEVLVVTAGGKQIAKALPGGGAPNRWCDSTPLRSEAENEDSQSVGTLISFGKFRYIQLGDLTWNNGRRLVCPNNLIGPVDVYETTHHGMNVEKEMNPVVWGYSSCSQAEVWGLAPRVAILNAGPNWHAAAHFNWYGNPKNWDSVRHSPGLEDAWQMHYQAQGGTEHNAPEQFMANVTAEKCAGHWLKLTASQDGSFQIENSRTGFVKKYQARSR